MKRGACVDTSDCININAASLAENISNSVSIYPNPAENLVRITSLYNVNHVSVFNLTGKKVLSSTKTRLDVSILPSVLYMVSIETEKGIVTKKIIKQ